MTPRPPRPGPPTAPPAPGPVEPESTTAVLLLAVTAVLCLVGLVMVLSASSVQALRQYGSSWLFFRRQVLWLVVGSGALAVGARVDYRAWRRAAGPLLALSAALLAVVLVPGVGIAVGGSSRWLGVGGWRVQPSELAKLAVVLFSADLLARRSARMGDARATLRPVLLVVGAVVALVVRQPDLGSAIVIGCVAFTLLYVAGAPLRPLAVLALVAAPVVLALSMAAPYRRARLLSFLNPWADATNTGYQVVQSLVGLGSGRITGVGVGASRAKWGFLPNAHTDFIFAIIGEELGLVGSLLVIGLFLAFAVLAVRAAIRAPDRFGTLVGAGVAAWVGGQAFVNIGTVVGILPVTGVPLPFVSYGGSSLVILMGAVGVLLNVAGQGGRRPAPGPGPTAAPAPAPASAG